MAQNARQPWTIVVSAFYCLMAPHASADEAQIKFPIVFTSLDDLAELGLSRHWPLRFEEVNGETIIPEPAFPIGCYWYAGTNTRFLISVSEEFFAGYKAKGFSRESLCMGLASRALFDPETGQRLPTYVFRDDEVFNEGLATFDVDTLPDSNLSHFVPDIFPTKEALKAGVEAIRRGDLANLTDRQVESLQPDEAFLGDELPLRVPDCFKNGTPYLDCNWRYGLLTGRKLSEAAPRRYREVGETIDRHMQALVKHGTWQTINISPYLQRRVWGLTITWDVTSPVSTWSYSPTVGFTTGDTMGVFNGVRTINNGKPLVFEVGDGLHLWAEEVTWFDVSPNLPRGYGYNLTARDEGFGDGGFSADSIRTAHDGTRSSSRFSKTRLKRLLR